MKIRYQIAFIFMGITGLILLTFSLVVYFISAYERKEDFSSRLKNRAITAASLMFNAQGVGGDLLRKVDSLTVNTLYNESVSIYNHKNELQYRSLRSPGDSLIISEDILNEARLKNEYSFSSNGKEGFALHYSTDYGYAVIVVSALDNDGKRKLKKLSDLLLVSFISCLVLSFMAGLFFSYRLLSPLKKISDKVNTITAKELDERLESRKVKDEWQQLISTFNELLLRLQESFEVQGRFIANASHELSTPLTSIISQIDVALLQKRNAEEYLHVLNSVRSDVQQMSDLTKQLLDIANTARGGVIQTTSIRVDEVLMELPAMLQQVSKEYTVKIHFDELPENEDLCTLNASHNLLLAAFRNVTENGCKYSPDKKVDVSLSFTEKKIIILFTNRIITEVNGEENIDNIFQPFYRGKNTFGQGGYGLGLSLTKRIILLHKGEIKAETHGSKEVKIIILLPSFGQ